MNRLYGFQEKWKRLGSLEKRLCPSPLVCTSLSSWALSYSPSCKPSLPVPADTARTAACQPGSTATDNVMLLVLALESDRNAHFGWIPPARFFPGTCPVCQFVGPLSFLQQSGADRACHTRGVEARNLHWLVWLSVSRCTWSVAETSSSPRTLQYQSPNCCVAFVEREQSAVLWPVEYLGTMCGGVRPFVKVPVLLFFCKNRCTSAWGALQH